MDKLDLILRKLESLEEGQKSLEEGQKSLAEGHKSLVEGYKSLAEGQKELNMISRAIRDRQDETDAKLDALSMDVHKLYGKVEAQQEQLKTLTDEFHTFRKETKFNFRQLEGHMRLQDNDLDEALERIEQLESRQ